MNPEIARLFEVYDMLTIENLERVHNRGNLKATLDVRLKTAGGDWLIRGCRIIQQTGQKAWFSLPVVSWENEKGEVCYKTILELPAGLKRRISDAGLSTYYETQTKAA